MRSKKAEDLIRHYRQKKFAAMRKPKLMKNPKFLAGNLLAVYKTEALGALKKVQAELSVDQVPEVENLLREAINDELFKIHGTIECSLCEKKAAQDEQVIDWLLAPYSMKWVCPECEERRKLGEGDKLPSNLVHPNTPRPRAIESEEID